MHKWLKFYFPIYSNFDKVVKHLIGLLLSQFNEIAKQIRHLQVQLVMLHRIQKNGCRTVKISNLKCKNFQ